MGVYNDYSASRRIHTRESVAPRAHQPASRLVWSERRPAAVASLVSAWPDRHIETKITICTSGWDGSCDQSDVVTRARRQIGSIGTIGWELTERVGSRRSGRGELVPLRLASVSRAAYQVQAFVSVSV